MKPVKSKLGYKVKVTNKEGKERELNEEEAERYMDAVSNIVVDTGIYQKIADQLRSLPVKGRDIRIDLKTGLVEIVENKVVENNDVSPLPQPWSSSSWNPKSKRPS